MIGLPTTQRNYWSWWKNRNIKIYHPYFFHSKKNKIWGVSLPFIGYFMRYYGEFNF